MKCSKCGKSIEEGRMLCEDCVKQIQGQMINDNQNKKGIGLIIVILIIAITGGILLFITLKDNKNKPKTNDKKQEETNISSNEDISNNGINSNKVEDIQKIKKMEIEQSATNLLRSAEEFATTYMINNYGDWIGNTIFTCDGTECSAIVNGEKEKLDISSVPTSGSIQIDDAGQAKIIEPLVYGSYKCTQSNSIICQKNN